MLWAGVGAPGFGARAEVGARAGAEAGRPIAQRLTTPARGRTRSATRDTERPRLGAACRTPCTRGSRGGSGKPPPRRSPGSHRARRRHPGRTGGEAGGLQGGAVALDSGVPFGRRAAKASLEPARLAGRVSPRAVRAGAALQHDPLVADRTAHSKASQESRRPRCPRFAAPGQRRAWRGDARTGSPGPARAPAGFVRRRPPQPATVFAKCKRTRPHKSKEPATRRALAGVIYESAARTLPRSSPSGFGCLRPFGGPDGLLIPQASWPEITRALG